MNSKRYIIYYCKSAGTFVVTEPLPWSKQNQQHFPKFDFINSKPRTEDVNLWLQNNRNFLRENYEGVVVLYNLNPNIEL